jgi:hypothetical protein
MGANSLLNLTTGIRNVGVGNNTGTSLVSGDYNVDIGWGVTGAGDETGVVRIGNPTYATTTYVAGIKDSVVTGAAVYVNSSGQLGVLASSERYKTDIESIPFSENKLQQLRPVTFHLKTEPTGTLQYGLIAEEVDKVYPELVIRNAGGQIQGVRYDELAPILLRQVQELQLRLAAQESELTGVRAQNADQAAIQATQLNAAQLQIAAQDAKLASIETLVRDMQQQVAHLNTQAEGGSQVAMR